MGNLCFCYQPLWGSDALYCPGAPSSDPSVSVQVEIYVRSDSADCRALKQWLTEMHVSYQEFDVAKPENRMKMFQRYGVLVVPIVVVNKRAYFGFEENRDHIRRAILNLPPP